VIGTPVNFVNFMGHPIVYSQISIDYGMPITNTKVCVKIKSLEMVVVTDCRLFRAVTNLLEGFKSRVLSSPMSLEPKIGALPADTTHETLQARPHLVGK
jgi:hypothetical protein